MKYFRLYGKNFEAYLPLDGIRSFGMLKKHMWVIMEDKSFETNLDTKEQLKALKKEITVLNGDHHILGIHGDTK